VLRVEATEAIQLSVQRICLLPVAQVLRACCSASGLNDGPVLVEASRRSKQPAGEHEG
jgi:hypothetical protein